MSVTQNSAEIIAAMREAYRRNSSRSMSYCPTDQTLLAMFIAGQNAERAAAREPRR